MDTETILRLVTYAIPILTPLITAAIKRWWRVWGSKIPKLGLVVLQPVLGAILAGLTLDEPAFGAGLGAVGLYVREVWDQGGKALGLIERKKAVEV